MTAITLGILTTIMPISTTLLTMFMISKVLNQGKRLGL